MVVGRWPRGSYDIPFAASDGRVYAFPRPDVLTAYERHTGTVIWEADVPTGFLAAGDGYVVVSSDGKVTAVDSSGAIQWSASLPGPSWYLTEADGSVFATRQGRFAVGCGD